MTSAAVTTRFWQVDSNDPEVVSTAVSNILGSVRYTTLPDAVDFYQAIQIAQVDDIFVCQSFSWTGFSANMEAAAVDRFAVNFVEAGYSSSGTNRALIKSESGEAFFVRDFNKHTMVCQPHTTQLSVVIPFARYLRLAAGEFGNPFADLAAMRPMARCSEPGIKCLKQIAKMLMSVTSKATLDGFPTVGAHLLSEAFLGLFIEGWPRDVSRRRTSSSRPFYIKRAVEWIHLHAADKVNLEDMATASGVSVRTLQLGFQSSYGLTPMSYLFKIRLENAYRDLLNAPSATTVDEIARRWRFSNPGKFSAHVREVYGQNPLEIRKSSKKTDL